MLLPDAEFLARAYQARDKLVEQFLNQPEVSLIDIGHDPANPEESQRLVLRVHVRQPMTKQMLGLPEEIDGIPVRLVTGDYRLE